MPTASTVNPTNNYVKKPKIKILLKTFVSLLCSVLYSKSTSATVCECCCVLYLMLYWEEKVPSESTETTR